MALRRRAAERANGASREVDLDAMVASGPAGAYEALQLYRSKATRLRTKNDPRGCQLLQNYNDDLFNSVFTGAIQVIVQGSKCLLSHGYENAGAELATLLLDTLNDSHSHGHANTIVESDAELRNLISDLEKSFAPTSKHRIELLKGCVKWTNKHGNREVRLRFCS